MQRPQSSVPISTYRLQLRGEFGFDDAAHVVPYLAALGVSHVYCSPVLQAAPASPHGYDVVDHTKLSEDLGGDAGWAHLVQACRDNGLGLVVDVVPNHMALPTPASVNPALWEALAKGSGAATSDWLDLDRDALDGRMLLPVLGRPLDEAVTAGEITVDTAAGVIRYFDHEFPIAAGSAAGVDDSPASITALLERQHYLLADWHDASTSLNYRRFFDVTTLLGVRVELPQVFDETHARVLQLVADGEIDGLRIDHVDGLADPAGYLERLRAETDGVWTVVEKILEDGEQLPASWACDGTTGYDVLAAVGNVFIDPAAAPQLDRIWRDRSGPELAEWDRVVDSAKRLVLEESFRPEVARLVGEALEALRATAPDDLPDVDVLTAGMGELLVAMDVYRVYPSDTARLDDAVARAHDARPDLSEVIDRLGAIAAPTTAGPTASFARRFAQTTGPVMAKGVEDTSFYRYHRLIAANEVGSDPGILGRPVAEFHAAAARLATDWPATMTTLSTHDTKRSEDVRSRLLVLAELPEEWERAVGRWDARAETLGVELDAPTRYLIWQTLVGAWPLPADRLLDYLDKATREAKLHTSWTDPVTSYDEAVRAFARAVTGDQQLTADLSDWTTTHVLTPGRTVSLGQKLVALTMPGVPDVYQGNEITDLSLVDPDNRRPVDYAKRSELLTALADGSAPMPPLADDSDGIVKLAVTWAALHARRAAPEVFATGEYVPLTATGDAANHLLGFVRGGRVAVLATRLPVGLAGRGGWRDTVVELPAGNWTDALTGRPAASARVGDLLDVLPVALLVRADGIDHGHDPGAGR